jgi:hypothetical protein
VRSIVTAKIHADDYARHHPTAPLKESKMA